jgi:hypothetical protein
MPATGSHLSVPATALPLQLAALAQIQAAAVAWCVASRTRVTPARLRSDGRVDRLCRPVQVLPGRCAVTVLRELVTL